MANYTVRIVLHDADDTHYDKLHEAMAAKLMALRKIKGRDGVWYDLPDGEYNISSSLTTVGLRDAVGAIADSIKAKPRPSVLVTRGSRAFRLKPVPGDS